MWFTFVRINTSRKSAVGTLQIRFLFRNRASRPEQGGSFWGRGWQKWASWHGGHF